MSEEEKKAETTEDTTPSSQKASNDTNSQETKAPEENLEEVIQKLTEEKDKFYTDYLRAVADQENIRKRSAKEKEEALKFGQESFFKDLLPVLDSLEKAFQGSENQENEKADLTSLREGVDLISKKLLQTLEKNGLKPISSKGEAYNPNLHQAVQTEKSPEVKEAIVKEEYMKGYELHGRLLRACMVSVLLPEEDS